MPDLIEDRSPTRPARLALPWWLAAAAGVAMLLPLAWAARHAVAPGGSGDFTTVYAASRAWAFGHDPYDADGLVREWFAADGSPFRVPNTQHTPSVYPPGTFLVVAPLAVALKWPLARAVWCGMNLSLIAAMLAALLSLARLHWTDWRAPALVAAVLALGPVRDGVIIGQPIVATTATLVLAIWAAARHWDVAAGLLLTVAVALKPPVAGPFALYFLLRRRWTVGSVALVLGGAAQVVAGVRLSMAGVPWLANFVRNVHAAELPGAVNDPTFHNIERFDLVNLHVLLHAFLDNRHLVVALVLLTVAVLAGLFGWAVLRNRGDRAPADAAAGLPARGLAELGFIAAWAVLPVYHRWHDAAPLVLVLAWAAVAFPVRRWTAAALVAGGLVMLFVASLALNLNKHRAGGYLPARAGVLMEGFLLPNQCWAALLLCGLLLLALWRRAPDTPRL